MALNLKRRRIALNTLENRRDQLRVPLNLKFRLRESYQSYSYLAESCDINAHGVKVITDAPLQPDMCVELWPEDEGGMQLNDYAEGSYFVHGDVVWSKKNQCTQKTTYGIVFKRKVDWSVPMQALTEKMGPVQQVDIPPQFVLDAMVDGVFSVDADWRISTFNKAAEELTGWKREDAIGLYCHDVFKSNSCGEGCVLAESITSNKPVENRSVFITHANGNRIGVAISATPLTNREGEIVGGVQVFREAKSLLGRDVILDNVADGIFTVDTHWRITSFNKAAEDITGVPGQEAIGQYCSDIFHSSICGKSCAIATSISTGQPDGNRCIQIRNANNEQIPVSISAAPLYDNQGNLIGGVETFRDLRPSKVHDYGCCKQNQMGDMISNSPAMNRICEILPQIAESGSNVLILGESGTGKEILAKALHGLSDRADGPLITVNCGALPDTLMESELFGCKAGAYTDAKTDRIGRIAAAEGGTLFLDEIGEVSLAMQVKLLRVLDTKRYELLGGNESIEADIRILAATNCDLQVLLEKGQFREDLFYRLNVVNLKLPTLRDRIHDIPLLVDHFIEKFNAERGMDVGGLDDETLRIMMEYDFPGNIRELQNIIEYAFILCKGGLIGVKHLPATMRGSSSESGPEPFLPWRKPLLLQEVEKMTIFDALQRNSWKKMKTCRELGISKDTLRRKISRYELLGQPVQHVA
jgi:PAS domain S-box-containing protein